VTLIRIPMIDRILPRITPTTVGCWEWGGYNRPDGRAQISDADRRAHMVYSLLYEHLVGPVPSGMELDHLCRQPWCCNPFHLEAVPPRINKLRGISPPAVNAQKTHCARGHALDLLNTYVTKDGRRQCRTCQRARGRVYDTTKRVA